MTASAIATDAVSVRFGDVTAVDGVTFAAPSGAVTAIVGENGAGKSTLMNVLFGLIRPTAGSVSVGGKPIRFSGARDAIAAGIGMVHQHFRLVSTLTVAENIALGDEPRRGLLYDDGAACARVEALARSLGFQIDPRARVDALSVGAQQRTEIMKSLARGARVLIFDEPTAVLAPQEADDLFTMVRALTAQGSTVLFISHKLDEVAAIADHIAVMRAGKLVTQLPAAGSSPRDIARLMVGRDPVDVLPRGAFTPGRAVLTLDAIRLDGTGDMRILDDVGLTVHAGEIVGIAGVEGNGQAELAAIATGTVPPSAGRVSLLGDDVTGVGVKGRAARGLAHVPGDRLRQAVAPNLTLEENLVLGQEHAAALRGPLGLSPRKVRVHAEALIAAHDVRPADPTLPFRALSGGNQQKAVIGRELSRAPTVLVAAHPTRGVDIGAVESIRARLLAERDRGAAVLLISSDLAEILALADRVLVLSRGRVVHEVRATDTDARKLGAHMLGAAA